jgi:septum formation protein
MMGAMVIGAGKERRKKKMSSRLYFRPPCITSTSPRPTKVMHIIRYSPTIAVLGYIVLTLLVREVSCFPSLQNYQIRPSLLRMSDQDTTNPTSSKGTLLLSNMHKIGLEASPVLLILASASPRRREILDMMGLSGRYAVQPSPLDETALQIELSQRQIEPNEYTRILAERKAAALCDELLNQQQNSRATLIIGSDTIVEHGGKILEKPNNTNDAYDMLMLLSGNWHVVHTGVAVYGLLDDCKEKKLMFSFTDTAKVKFASLTRDDIKSYIETNEPMDKAGSYGIQGIGGQLVECMEGDFFTVMGLPMHRLSKHLNSAIVDLGL